MGRMRLPSVGLGGIARCISPPLFLSISLVFREPKLDFTKLINKARARRLPFLAVGLGWLAG